MSYVRDALIIAGLAAIGTGLYFYDWRIAAIVVGAIVVVIGTASAALDARGSHG